MDEDECKEKITKIHYECKECHLLYETAEKAFECEKWCRKNGSCSFDIRQHAVNAHDGDMENEGG